MLWNRTVETRSAPRWGHRVLFSLAVVLGCALAVLTVWGFRPLEVWAGGTALFIGGRYLPPGNSWYTVAGGRFASPAVMRVRSYLGLERGVYLCVGDFYYVVSWFRGRPAPPLKSGERVSSTLYPR